MTISIDIRIDIGIDIDAQADEVIRDLLYEVWEHIENDAGQLPMKAQSAWGILRYKVNPPDTEAELVDLVERIIEDEERNGNQWAAQLMQERLDKIMEAGR